MDWMDQPHWIHSAQWTGLFIDVVGIQQSTTGRTRCRVASCTSTNLLFNNGLIVAFDLSSPIYEQHQRRTPVQSMGLASNIGLVQCRIDPWKGCWTLAVTDVVVDWDHALDGCIGDIQFTPLDTMARWLFCGMVGWRLVYDNWDMVQC